MQACRMRRRWRKPAGRREATARMHALAAVELGHHARTHATLDLPPSWSSGHSSTFGGEHGTNSIDTYSLGASSCTSRSVVRRPIHSCSELVLYFRYRAYAERSLNTTSQSSAGGQPHCSLAPKCMRPGSLVLVNLVDDISRMHCTYHDIFVTLTHV